jgi:hypothetical protein
VRRVLLAAVAVLAVGGGQAKAAEFNPDPVFPVGPISGTVSHQILKLDHVASALSGRLEDPLGTHRHAIVNCWSRHDWTRFQAWRAAHHLSIDVNGVTFPATNRIQLSPFVCETLQQTLARSGEQPLFTAFAITVLAHESAHASGVRVEHLAECRAIKTEPRAAHLLGISHAVAERLQHIYRGTVYPYESPTYNTPPCPAGKPGIVVPDTLGTTANVRPLARTGTAVAHSLSGWKGVGGGLSIGPLSPCSPIGSRTAELARFSDGLFGPNQQSLLYSDARIRTQRAFARTVAHFPGSAACYLTRFQKELRETHSSATVSAGQIPNAITQLSPEIRADREIYEYQGETWDRDSISILDPTTRTIPDLFFRTRAGKFPLSLEVSATKAVLQAVHQDG